MSHKTEMPERKGCPKSDGWLKRHDWQWSSMWNGNNKKVLPFHKGTSGVGRSGWRCYGCGKMVWDDRDETFALKFAYFAGHLPYAIKQFVKDGKPFQIISDGKIINVGELEKDEGVA